MLYKNDEPYKMTAQDFNDMKKKYPKYPIRLIYPESRVRKSRNKHNRLPDKPNSISFPLSATVKTDKGTEMWRYAENKIIGANNQTIWQPHNLILRGSMILQSTDIELVFWLYNCCPFLEGGLNWNQKTPKCVIEDLVGAAERKAIREEEMATFKAMVYSPKMGLKESKLRQLAKAYFINDVDDLSYAQVKLAIENTVTRDKVNGIKKFLEMAEAEQVMEVRSNLQDAIDRKIITYMIAKKTWAWVTANGLKNEPICQIGSVADPSEALYDYYLGNRSFAQELVAALKGEKVVLAAGADDIDDEPDPE